MRRSLLTVLIVAALSAWISRGERAVGVSAAPHTAWVRTADGWEPRRALTLAPPATPSIPHPALVAAMQLAASLVFLRVFPARVAVLAAPPAAPSRPERRRADRRAPALT